MIFATAAGDASGRGTAEPQSRRWSCSHPRRHGWTTGAELEEAAKRSIEIAERDFPDTIRWIRSHVITEDNGALGTVCIYQVSDAGAVRRHAAAVGMRADEVLPVAGTVIVRPDPERRPPT